MRPCGFTAPSCGLRHAPEERQRPLCDTGDVLAPRRAAQEEAGRRIDYVLVPRFVGSRGRGLPLIEFPGFEPCCAFLSHGFARGPAKPGLVAIAANGVVDGRIDAVRAGVPGMKHLPAPLPWRRLLGAAGNVRCPPGWGGGEISTPSLSTVRWR